MRCTLDLADSSMTTVFWPSEVTKDGFMYGWIQDRTACVAGVLHADILADAEAILAKALCKERLQALVSSCGTPVILGHCAFHSLAAYTTPEFKDSTITFTRPYYFYHYYRHTVSSRRFYAVREEASSRSNGTTPMEAYLSHDFTRHRPRSCKLDTIVNQLNSARLVEYELRQCQTTCPKKQDGKAYNTSFIPNTLKLVLGLPGLRDLFDLCFLPTGNMSMLKEFSFTARQIGNRIGVLQLLSSRKFVHQSGDIKSACQEYIEYHNTLWVILNDIIIGIAFRFFLNQNQAILNQLVTDGLEGVLAHRMEGVLLWLDSWPAGLKLNTELSRFYSQGFIGLITQWATFLRSCLRFLPMLNLIIETASLMGMTMATSLLLDLLGLLTAHFYACYLISSVIYRHILILIGSLWNLFRGKRYNVLRNRTDPWDYEIDQLLLGTILFTLAAHLFPTVWVYYAVFALVRLSLIALYATGETLLAFMNHFPLFALMLRLKDPQRLPGDIYLLTRPTSDRCSVTLMVLSASCSPDAVLLTIPQSHPLPLSVIFAQYSKPSSQTPLRFSVMRRMVAAQLWRQLLQHYHPFRLGRWILQGRVLATFTHGSVYIPWQ
ncbi:N-acetylglucosaminyl transferase component-domain-containing protein [Pisolithus croceorrhizus]|nr:N-acetylglucosaminyl transferase component-domain-containing protein [Pisolithus croceorrhizus]